jgi:hypothetical protein
MSLHMTRRLSGLLAIVAGLLCAGALHAQEPQLTVRGRVIGPAGTALDSQRVVLHRVAGAEGATIAETTSASNGAFELVAPLSGDTSALLFVAVRYEGELYIGPAFREAEGGMDQVIQVGVAGTSASAMIGDGTTTAPPRTVGRATTSRSWMLWLIPLVGVLAVGLYMLVPRARIPADRELLIRVAELDERMETAPEAQRESLLQERSTLVAQLRSG